MTIDARVLALVLFTGCVGPASATHERATAGPEAFSPLTPLVRWREAERRRDLDAAERVLVLRDEAARKALTAHLQALASVPPGPVRSELEFHLVAGPAPFGEALYLALEPDGAGHACVLYTLVESGARARLALEAPPWDSTSLDASQRARSSRNARRAHWAELGEADLHREVERLRWTLAAQARAAEVASDKGLALRPFSPDPTDVLARIQDLDPRQVRDRVVAWLGTDSR